MKTWTRRGMAAVMATGLIVGGMTLAQDETPAEPEAAEPAPRMEMRHGPRVRLFWLPPGDAGRTGLAPGMAWMAPGAFGLPFGLGTGLALGTQIEVVFYDSAPDEGGDELQRLALTFGVDSELAFARAVGEALEGATHVVVEVGEQRRTIDFADVTLPADGRGLLPRELSGRFATMEGRSITVDLYDGDPASDGEVVRTLRFTVGEDSLAGFADAFGAAAADATHAVVTTHPHATTIDVGALRSAPDRILRGLRELAPRILHPGRSTF